jgi:YVTN family beta-propeller protein
VYLSRLRRLLVDANDEQLLVTHAAGYTLRVPPDNLDVHRFETLVERGRRELAVGQAERASLTLGDALALWRGRPLADLAFEPFAQTEIARLEELRLRAIEVRIEAGLALGCHDSLVAELEKLVAAHPYREGLLAQLMLAFYRSGRQAEALQTYRRARRTFSEELGIEPSPRLRELEGAILRHDSSLTPPTSETPHPQEEKRADRVSRKRGLPSRRFALAAALALVLAAAVAAAVRESAGHSSAAVQLAGNSVAVIDPETNTIVDEIAVGGKPSGLAVGEGFVWVGNHDNDTLLQIDPRSLDVVRTTGLGATPTDVEVGAGSVWVLSDWAVLRVNPATHDVVATALLPRRLGGGRWSHMEVGGNAVFVCTCADGPGSVIRIDATTMSAEPIRSSPVWMIAYGEGALWALTGNELDTIKRIDPKTKAVDTIPLGRIGESSGWRFRIAAGNGAIWVLAPASLWQIDSTTKRFVGSVALSHREEGSSLSTGDGAVWLADVAGNVLRVDPQSQSVAKQIPLGPLIYPADAFDSIAVGDGSVWVAVTSLAS